MFVLWGVPGDTPLMAVHNALCRLGHPPVFINQWDILDTDIEMCMSRSLAGFVRIPGQVIDLEKVTAVYVRAYDSQCLSIVARTGQGSAAWEHAGRIDSALQCWANLSPALVVNRPEAMATNCSKPYQALLIQSFGFGIPATLLTTDLEAVLAFWNQHGTIIYKSISGVRSIVSRLTSAHLERLECVRWCPTQFQQYIPGNDYRVHVVGSEVFTCEIFSPADDYRYAARQGAPVAVHAFEMPQEVAERCIALTVGMGLSVAGIDLRLHPDGTWYCLEVNPSPAFPFYQQESGHTIDEAIAHLLLQRLH